MRALRTLVIGASCVPLLAIASSEEQQCGFAALAVEGRITATGSNLGRHMGESVSLVVNDRGGQGISTVMPAGWVLRSEDPALQDLMLVRAEPIMIAPGGSVTVTCRAFCVEANDAGPSEGAVYNLGNLAGAKLVALAEFIDAGKYADDAVLFSVWTVTGERPISSIPNDDPANEPLRRKVSELTGQALPWYTVSYDDTQDDHRFSNEASTVNGRFDFSMANNGVLTIVATDAEGHTLTELGHDRHLGPGNYTMNIALTVKGWKRGTYSIRAYEGGSNLVKRIDFVV